MRDISIGMTKKSVMWV